MFERYKDLLNKAITAKLGTLTAWYSVFRLREDPFLSQIDSEEIDFFVNRENVTEPLIYDIGVSSRGIPINILVVGPFGSGKTTILHYINTILKKLKELHPDEYSFIGTLYSSDILFEPPNDSEEQIEDIQLWVKIGKTRRDYLFVDDAKPAQIQSILRKFTQTCLKIFAISPLNFNQIYSNLQVTPKIHFLHPFDIKATEEMLDKRIKRVLMEEEGEVSLFDYFEEAAISVIHKYAMGVPYLILKCASQSLQLFLNVYSHDPTSNKVERQKVTADIATRACQITKCFYAVTAFENVSRTKQNVLRQCLDRGKTPTEISSRLKKDRTTISRHLSDLREMGLVEFMTRGRESVYEVTKPVKIRFEIENLPDGVWKIAST